MLTVQLPSLQIQTFLLAHCHWGMFRKKERLPLCGRNSMHTDDVKSVWTEFGHKH